MSALRSHPLRSANILWQRYCRTSTSAIQPRPPVSPGLAFRPLCATRLYSQQRPMSQDGAQRQEGASPLFIVLYVSVRKLTLRLPKGKPLNFGIVLFPAFQLLDAFGPLDALSLVSRSHQMNLYTIAATLDPVSTKLAAPGQSDFGLSIQPTHTFETAPPLDVLLVPGGQGTRYPAVVDVVAYIQKAFPSLQYLITVCTGAGLAARAGVLDGKRATTNKLSWDQTVALRPQVEWVHQARWVRDGHIWTSSGISAGIDVTFAWIEHVYGHETAKTIADRMEYHRETDPDHDPFAALYAQSKS